MRICFLILCIIFASGSPILGQDFKLNESFKTTSDFYGGSFVYDINKDGFDDILYADKRDVNLLLNKATGQFEFDKIKLAVDQSVGKTFQIWDLDSDGDLDILMGASSRLIFFENKSTENKIEFAKATKDFLFFGNQSTSVPIFKVGYINQDSLFDVVIAYGKTKVLLQKPDKSFFEYEIPNSIFSGVKKVEITDLDGDEKADLVFCRDGGVNQIGLYYYLNSNNSFNVEQTLVKDIINDFVVMDFNNDGRKDILSMNYSDDAALLFFKNTGTQSLYDAIKIQTNILYNYKSLSLGNLDDKVGLDVAIGYEQNAGIDILNYQGIPEPSWKGSKLWGSKSTSERIFISDLDGDKDDDIIQMLSDDGFLIYERLLIPSYTEDLNLNIKLFPNPCLNTLNIEHQEIISGLKIKDAYGRLLADLPNVNNTNITINTEQLSAGYYLVEIKTLESKVYTAPLVINK